MFDGINQLIQQVAESDRPQLTFILLQLLNVPFGYVHALWFGYKMKLNLKKISLLFVVAFIAIYFLMLVLHWVFTGFSSFGGQNMIMVYVWVPLLARYLCRMFKITWTEECYIHATSLPLSHGIGHIACMFQGCCGGYAAAWGVYNPVQGINTFPIQLVEAIVYLAITAILIVRSHKRNYVADDKQFPLMLVMCGSARFILEFFRDNTKILLGCSDLSLHALFMVVVGVIWLVRIKKKLEQSVEPAVPTLKRRVRR